ncbi:AmmeMemoRadiSam system protein A [Sedimenticola sp.]|uniref:AmmeMemoRadiSam system protein A n=1 Tax=Sedimenticola sp. TaxID=1940285 RepID=UPI003D09A701
MSSTDPLSEPLCDNDRETLLSLAKASIQHGLQYGRAITVDPADYTEPLRKRRASFVTLLMQGQLRGCIGHLEATQPMVSDVAANAFAAAFEDPRFPALSADELPQLSIHISLLTPAQPMTVGSETELIGRLQPGIDGLILQEGHHRGTFLPSVWEQLPDPKTFLAQLKIKAGLPSHYWSDTIRVSRYTTESFP